MLKKRLFVVEFVVLIVFSLSIYAEVATEFNPKQAAFDAAGDGYSIPGTSNVVKGSEVTFDSVDTFSANKPFEVNGQTFQAGTKVKVNPDGTMSADSLKDNAGNVLKGEDLKFTDKGFSAEKPFEINGQKFSSGTNVLTSDAGKISADSLVDENGIELKAVQNLLPKSDGSYDFEKAQIGKTQSTGVTGSKTSHSGRTTISEQETSTESLTRTMPVKIDQKNSENNEFDKEGRLIKSGKGQSMTGKSETGQTLFSAFNYEGFEAKDNGFTIKYADSFSYDTSTSTKASNIFIPFDGSFKVDHADQVIIGTKIFNLVGNSEFKIQSGNLKKAKVTSDADNNEYRITPDIGNIGDVILVQSNKTNVMDYETITENYDESLRNGFKLRLDEGIKADFVKSGRSFLEFTTLDNSGNLRILDNPTPFFELMQGITKHKTKSFEEKLITYGISKGEMDANLGIGYVILAPETSPGGEYVYEDLLQKEKAFAIYNPSQESYEIGFKKTAGFFDFAMFRKQITSGNSWGYVDFSKNELDLNGKVKFLTYRDKSSTETAFDYLQLTSPTMKPVYEGNRIDETNIVFKDDKIELIKLNSDNPNAIIRSGIFQIHETKADRWLSTSHSLIFPDRIWHIEAIYEPKITISGKTLEMSDSQKSIFFHDYESDGAKEVIKRTRQVISFQDYVSKSVWKKWQPAPK